MTSSRKYTVAAYGGFALISLVVLGGIGWATVATFELAKKNVGEDHDRKISLAVGRIESYIGGVLNSESFRNYFDYLAFNVREPLAVYTKNEDIVDASQVLLASPIAINGPPLDWIELYFYVHPDGQLTSPQVPDELWRWTLADSTVSPSADKRARETFEWLGRELPTIDIRLRMARALDRNCALLGHAHRSGESHVDRMTQRGFLSAHGSAEDVHVQSRRRSSGVRDTQASYHPPAQCESQHIVTKNIRGVPLPVRSDADGQSGELTEVTLGPMAPGFWLEAPHDGVGGKLAFVRECYADADVFHQGFVADWPRLQRAALAFIGDLFPQADLVAVEEHQEPDLSQAKTHLANLPVRLNVFQLKGQASVVAWQSVRGVLITTWVAALLLLAVAGWGIRNLLLSSERRMQFAYAVTHELRTPLTTFRLYADMLSAGLVPEGSRQEYLDTLNRESLRLSNMVEGVLEYARVENRKVKLNPVKTDAGSLLREIAEAIESRCRQTGVVPVTKDNIPDPPRLRTDIDVVKHICGVLINNACRHARDAENPTVVLELGHDNGVVHFDIIDSGAGIDRADARTIFKPFRRGRKADQEARGGIGLGLALARCWARLLGGKLELVDRHHAVYGGAHFRLTLPLRD